MKNKLECKFKIGDKVKCNLYKENSVRFDYYDNFGEIIEIRFIKDFVYYVVKYKPKSSKYVTTYRNLKESVLKRME